MAPFSLHTDTSELCHAMITTNLVKTHTLHAVHKIVVFVLAGAVQGSIFAENLK